MIFGRERIVAFIEARAAGQPAPAADLDTGR